jgi:N-formylglutamate deformylase
MTDHHTLDLFAWDVPDDQVVRAPVSRLVVDVERFEDDGLEPMAERGMGVVYRTTSDLRPLRRAISAEERASLIREWYAPHHRQLSDSVQSKLDMYGRALIIDAHSFPEHPLPYETDHASDRPQICIGTDSFHTSPGLEQALERTFCEAGFSVKINSPFAGALVPMHHYGSNAQVESVMIEVKRSLYCDEITSDQLPGYLGVRASLRECIIGALIQVGVAENR